jgi:hypothetical protein
LNSNFFQGGNDDDGPLFPSLRCFLWRIYYVVQLLSSVMVRVFLLRVLHLSMWSLFYISLFLYIFAGLCASLMS